MTRGVLWDSSAILALLDADDADHVRAIEVARQIAIDRRPSFITNYIEAEAHALLLRKLGRTVARQWLLTGGLPVVAVLPAEEQHAKDILARHVDKDWTLCDAVSFPTTFGSTDGSRFLAWNRGEGGPVRGFDCRPRPSRSATAYRAGRATECG